MKRCRSQAGQAAVLTLLFCTVLLGMTALVLDVGSWFREQRDVQAVADAAALAGAQGLPDTVEASALAEEYSDRNGGSSPSISFTGTDRIRVEVERPTPGFFAKVFGIESVTVRAHAVARSFTPNAARWAAPIGVDHRHPLIAGCEPEPCFREDTTLDLEKVGPGAFRLLNLDGSSGGVSPATLAEWMLEGFDGWMPLGWYYSDPGAKFDSTHMQGALSERIGEEVLFPIYDAVSGNGSNLRYHVIGWIGFVITDFEARGNSGTLDGYFTRVIWEGIENESSSPSTAFGVRSIELIE